ncbi:hypothetical protein CSC12_1678 [Klebsiella michiganensis]|nr:hypothetical protein CSC12_1678 [Klebsiella michiganensis]
MHQAKYNNCRNGCICQANDNVPDRFSGYIFFQGVINHLLIYINFEKGG